MTRIIENILVEGINKLQNDIIEEIPRIFEPLILLGNNLSELRAINLNKLNTNTLLHNEGNILLKCKSGGDITQIVLLLPEDNYIVICTRIIYIYDWVHQKHIG